MRRKASRVGFVDMPTHLRHVDADSPAEIKRRRAAWLEEHGLTLVDLQAWRRAQDPRAARRPPSRRKFMRPEELAKFDEQLEKEPPRW
jgi:hypothetical protein